MENRVAVVTGGSSGIGLAASLAFAEREFVVVIAGRNQEKGARAVQQIRDKGGIATFCETNVSDSTSVQHLFSYIRSELGRLDCAFNNAGYFPGLHPLFDYTEEMWDKAMAVNAKGTWLCLKNEIPLMIETGGGTIVNCSSVASLIGVPSHYGYTASKCAIDGLTRVAAMEFATSNIRVNAVCPGVIETEMVAPLLATSREQFTSLHPIGRIGKPNEEIARAVVWLCSDEASFITGQVLPLVRALSAPSMPCVSTPSVVSLDRGNPSPT